jgi:hypothetical protein
MKEKKDGRKTRRTIEIGFEIQCDRYSLYDALSGSIDRDADRRTLPQGKGPF